MSRKQIEINRNLWHAVGRWPRRCQHPGCVTLRPDEPGPAGGPSAAPPPPVPRRAAGRVGIHRPPGHTIDGRADRTDARWATEERVTSRAGHRRDAGVTARSSCRRGPSATPARGSRCSPSRASRATRTRRSPTPRRSTGSPASPRRWRCTSRGTRSTTTASSPARRGLGVALGTINSNTFQDDDYKLGSVCHPDPRVRRKAVDHLLDCVDIMDATGSRDLKLWFADGTNYPGQDDIRARQDRLAEALRDGLRPARRGPADASSSTSSSSRRSTRPTCRTGARPRPLRRARAQGARSSSTPATTRRARTSSSSSRRCCGAGKLGALRLQLALLRRRRPDGRGGRPVPAVPDHARGRAGRRARARGRRRVHARPVPQHRAEDPRPDPLGDERPGGDGQGAAGRPATRSTRRRRPATCSGANAVLMDAYDTDVRPLLARGPRRTAASTPTRWRPTRGPATPSGSTPSASAGSRQDGAHDASSPDPATPTRTRGRR